MSKNYITPEEGARLKELYQAYAAASRRAVDAIRDPEAFRKADAEAGVAMQEIKKIHGMGGRHWMS